MAVASVPREITLEVQQPVEPRLLADAVVHCLRDLIVCGKLAPETKLNERVLCDQLNISRTPLREALKFLASEGLVELLPNRGAIVAPLRSQTVTETFHVVAALQALAAELACKNASDADIAEIRALHYQMIAHQKRGQLGAHFESDQAVHLTLVACGANAALTNSYRGLSLHVRRARYTAPLSAERWDKEIQEHAQILAALEKRENAVVQQLLREHLHNKLAVIMERMPV